MVLPVWLYTIYSLHSLFSIDNFTKDVKLTDHCFVVFSHHISVGMSVPDHIVVRGQITHAKESATDVYVTKDSSISAVISVLEKKIHSHGTATLHAVGAANYKALKISVMLLNAHPGILDTNVTTDTIQTHDFHMPTVAGKETEIKERMVNSVAITIFRK